jgi:hypothetical protein
MTVPFALETIGPVGKFFSRLIMSVLEAFLLKLSLYQLNGFPRFAFTVSQLAFSFAEATSTTHKETPFSFVLKSIFFSFGDHDKL